MVGKIQSFNVIETDGGENKRICIYKYATKLFYFVFVPKYVKQRLCKTISFTLKTETKTTYVNIIF